MQIYFERSGGFSGLKLKTAVDTTQLPAEEAEQIERVLSTNQFLELPPDAEPTAEMDQFSYKMTVITGDWQHTAVFTDANASEELQPVIRRLTVIARQSASNNSADL